MPLVSSAMGREIEYNYWAVCMKTSSWALTICMVLCVVGCSTTTGPVEKTGDESGKGLSVQKRSQGPINVITIEAMNCLTGSMMLFSGQESSSTTTTSGGRKVVTKATGNYKSVSGIVYTTSITTETLRPNYNSRTGAGACPYTKVITHSSTMTGTPTPYEYQDVYEYDANCNLVSTRRVYQRGGC